MSDVAKDKKIDEKTVGELSLKEFTNLMVSVMETKAYLAAKDEEAVTRRIFKDAEVLSAVQPFRVSNPADLEKALGHLRKVLQASPKLQLTISFAIVKPESAT